MLALILVCCWSFLEHCLQAQSSSWLPLKTLWLNVNLGSEVVEDPFSSIGRPGHDPDPQPGPGLGPTELVARTFVAYTHFQPKPTDGPTGLPTYLPACLLTVCLYIHTYLNTTYIFLSDAAERYPLDEAIVTGSHPGYLEQYALHTSMETC